MSRIFLKPDEYEILFTEAKRIEENEVPMFQKDFWNKAQLVLPIERRRMNMSSGPRSVLHKKYEQWKSKPRNSVPKPEPKTEENGASHEPQIIFIEKPVQIEPDYGKIPTVALARILLERLSMYELVTKKIDTLADILKVKEEIDHRHFPDLEIQKVVRPPEPEKDKSIRVAVIGLLPDQEQEVEKAAANLPKKVELRFTRKDSPHQAIGSSVQYAICTRFVRHGMWDQARQQMGNDRVFYTDSPVNGTIQKLYDICARQ